MNSKLIILLSILSFITYSLQAKYIVQSNSDVYQVTEIGKCTLARIYKCEDDSASVTYYDDLLCEKEGETVNIDCKVGDCECTDKIPKGRIIEMHGPIDKCSDSSNPITLVFSKENSCYSYDDFSKRDENSFNLKIEGNEFVINGFDSDDCTGDSEVMFKGKLNECVSNENGDAYARVRSSSGFSISISLFSVLLFSLIIFLI